MRSEAALQDRKHFLISLSCRSGRREDLSVLTPATAADQSGFPNFRFPLAQFLREIRWSRRRRSRRRRSGRRRSRRSRRRRSKRRR